MTCTQPRGTVSGSAGADLAARRPTPRAAASSAKPSSKRWNSRTASSTLTGWNSDSSMSQLRSFRMDLKDPSQRETLSFTTSPPPSRLRILSRQREDRGHALRARHPSAAGLLRLRCGVLGRGGLSSGFRREDLECAPGAGPAGHPDVEGDQRGAEQLSERDVTGVINREVIAQFPDPGQQ